MGTSTDETKNNLLEVWFFGWFYKLCLSILRL